MERRYRSFPIRPSPYRVCEFRLPDTAAAQQLTQRAEGDGWRMGVVRHRDRAVGNTAEYRMHLELRSRLLRGCEPVSRWRCPVSTRYRGSGQLSQDGRLLVQYHVVCRATARTVWQSW